MLGISYEYYALVLVSWVGLHVLNVWVVTKAFGRIPARQHPFASGVYARGAGACVGLAVALLESYALWAVLRLGHRDVVGVHWLVSSLVFFTPSTAWLLAWLGGEWAEGRGLRPVSRAARAVGVGIVASCLLWVLVSRALDETEVMVACALWSGGTVFVAARARGGPRQAVPVRRVRRPRPEVPVRQSTR